jgi:glycosyltransferase involved in cell wall biosynthesis
MDAVARRKPDVALVMNVANGFFLPLLKARGIPSLVNVDGIEWDRDKWGRVAKTMFLTGAKLTARFGTNLVFDARAIEQRWKQQFDRDGVFIPYGGTDPGPLDVPLGLTSRGYALIVARFVPENSVPEFLDAAATISKSHPVVIVGSSGYGGDLDTQAASLADSSDNVRWLGHVSDDHLLFALLQHAGAYFHGHSVGGTNPALVQAMTCGAPVVARDTVYNREVLGAHGTYVAPEPAAIAEAVLGLLGDPAAQEQAADEARRRGASEYSWHDVCTKYEAALSGLLP